MHRAKGGEREGGMKEGGKWSHFCGTFDACVANAFTINLPCLLPAGGAKPKWSIEFCAIRRHCAAPPPPFTLFFPLLAAALDDALSAFVLCLSLSVGVIETFLAAARVEFSVPPQRTLSRPQSVPSPPFSFPSLYPSLNSLTSGFLFFALCAACCFCLARNSSRS